MSEGWIFVLAVLGLLILIPVFAGLVMAWTMFVFDYLEKIGWLKAISFAEITLEGVCVMKRFKLSANAKDLHEQGRIILAHGEQTGHCHEVVALETGTLPPAQFFEEPDGRRVLLVLEPCALRHDEHDLIALDPAKPVQFRQGDVYGLPIGGGAWEIRRQVEYTPEAIRQVQD